MFYLERAASALDVLSISGVPGLLVSTDIKFSSYPKNCNSCSFKNQLKIICSSPETGLDPTSHRSPMGP
jgi:hypothetical protein